jgi:hypothetical protein
VRDLPQSGTAAPPPKNGLGDRDSLVSLFRARARCLRCQPTPGARTEADCGTAHTSTGVQQVTLVQSGTSVTTFGSAAWTWGCCSARPPHASAPALAPLSGRRTCQLEAGHCDKARKPPFGSGRPARHSVSLDPKLGATRSCARRATIRQGGVGLSQQPRGWLSDLLPEPTMADNLDRPRVYVETTVVSYLTTSPSRDIVQAAHQQLTREWWERRANGPTAVAGTRELRRSSCCPPPT